MSDFEKRVRRGQIDYLLRIKPLLQPNFISELTEKAKPVNESNEKNKEFLEIDDFISKLNELTERIDVLEKKMDEEKEDSVRKIKIKEQILSLLEEHKKLSSSELSNLVNLSRTRCNEYFRELSKEGLAEGIIVGRQKFYKLVKR